MGLFEGRQRKQWRSALEAARRAEAVGNISQCRQSIRVALSLRSAVPAAWLDDLRDMLAQYESRSNGARALTFAALQAELSLDPELAAQWHSALGHVAAEIRRIEGDSDEVDLDRLLGGMQAVLSLDSTIPWEMKQVDVPPVWEDFLSVVRLTAQRGYALTSLQVLQAALPLSEKLPAQCGHQLAQVASTLGRESAYPANRRAFGQLSRGASEVASRTAYRPGPVTAQPVLPVDSPAVAPQPEAEVTAHALIGSTSTAARQQRYGEASRILRSAREEGADTDGLPPALLAIPDLAPWDTVRTDLSLSGPPQRWDRSQAGNVRLRWAARLPRLQLFCIVITSAEGPQLLARDLSREGGSGLAEVPVQLTGSIEECVAWGQQILDDRRLFLALVDEAAAWSPHATPQKIAEFVRGSAMPAVTLVDALPAAPVSMEWPDRPSQFVALANRLEELVLSRAPLDDGAQLTLARFLADGPLFAGTWGPYKTIHKALEGRADDLPSALGISMARIACLSSSHPAGPVEDVMSVVAPGEVGSRATLNYLDRRSRRRLRELSRRAPADYATVAAEFLTAVNSLHAQGDQLQRSNALDFVLYGGSLAEFPGKRFPQKPPMPQLHQRRWDPAQDIWRDREDTITSVLTGAANADIAGWAFQVLNDLDVPVPDVRPEMALLSGEPALQQRGVTAVLDRPEVIGGLTADAVATLIAILPVADSAALLATHGSRDCIERALEDLLLRPDRIPHLRVTGQVEQRAAELALDMANGPIPFSLAPAVELAIVKAFLLSGEHGDLGAVAGGLSLDQLADLRQEVGPLAATQTVAWLDDTIVMLASRSGWQAYSLASRWVGSSDLDLVRLGWRIAGGYFDSDAGFLSFVQGHGATPVAVAESLAGLAAAQQGSRVRSVLEWWAQSADNGTWSQSVAAIDRVVSAYPVICLALWPLLSERTDARISQRITQLPSLPEGMLKSLPSQAVATLDDRQTDALWSFLSTHPQRFGEDDPFALAVTVVPNPVLCSTAISILRSQNRIKDLWLPLIESGLPPAVEAGERHLRSLTDKDVLRAATLDLLDSGSAEARRIAMTLLSSDGAAVSWTDVLDEITEHRDPRIWREAAVRLDDISDPTLVQAFVHRVLTTRRRGRAAKTLVQEHSTASGSEATSAGLDVLLGMAQGAVPRDREWAISQLVDLAEAGRSVPGLDVIEGAD